MQSKELLKMALETSFRITLPLLEDLQDSPLTFPTPQGGNHALWIAGHLAFGEGQLICQTMQGLPNPVAEWKQLFDGGTEPSADVAKYPAYETVLAKVRQIRGQTMETLATLTEEQLDQPSKNVDPQFAAFFGTYRQCLLAAALHSMNHRGQLADCRRVLRRKPLLA